MSAGDATVVGAEVPMGAGLAPDLLAGGVVERVPPAAAAVIASWLVSAGATVVLVGAIMPCGGAFGATGPL